MSEEENAIYTHTVESERGVGELTGLVVEEGEDTARALSVPLGPVHLPP